MIDGFRYRPDERYEIIVACRILLKRNKGSYKFDCTYTHCKNCPLNWRHYEDQKDHCGYRYDMDTKLGFLRDILTILENEVIDL